MTQAAAANGAATPLTTEQEAQWAQVVSDLEAKGFTPSDVRKEVMKRTKPEEGGGLFSWAGKGLSAPITWSGVLIFALGVVAFLGLLKLIGMAFNVNIPLLHSASPVALTA